MRRQLRNGCNLGQYDGGYCKPQHAAHLNAHIYYFLGTLRISRDFATGLLEKIQRFLHRSSARSLLRYFVAIFAVQKMLHPIYAVVDSHFGYIKIVGDLTITQATSH